MIISNITQYDLFILNNITKRKIKAIEFSGGIGLYG